MIRIDREVELGADVDTPEESRSPDTDLEHDPRSAIRACSPSEG
jgi:hypothetical protein